jgi:hypothetical protein
MLCMNMRFFLIYVFVFFLDRFVPRLILARASLYFFEKRFLLVFIMNERGPREDGLFGMDDYQKNFLVELLQKSQKKSVLISLKISRIFLNFLIAYP